MSDSVGTAEFSAFTEERIRQSVHRCWACELVVSKLLECAHVISQGDTQFEYLQSLGIINFQLSGFENGIPLCAQCHNMLDAHLNPGWVFFPVDLDYFIEFELEDRRARTEVPRARLVPNAASYLEHQKGTGSIAEDAESPLYIRHILAPEEWPVHAARIVGEKPWGGDPIAAIRNSWIALGAVRNDAIPLESRQKLHYLLELYRTPLGQEVPMSIGPHLLPPPPSQCPEPDDDNSSKGKGKGREDELPKSNKRKVAAQVETLASKRQKRENAGKRFRSGVQAMTTTGRRYTDRKNIMSWIEDVEAYSSAPPTPVSAKNSKS